MYRSLTVLATPLHTDLPVLLGGLHELEPLVHLGLHLMDVCHGVHTPGIVGRQGQPLAKANGTAQSLKSCWLLHRPHSQSPRLVWEHSKCSTLHSTKMEDALNLQTPSPLTPVEKPNRHVTEPYNINESTCAFNVSYSQLNINSYIQIDFSVLPLI